MAQHIVLMNVLAPLLVFIARGWLRPASGPILLGAAALQLIALWGWHAPPALAAALGSLPMHIAMQASLLGAALLFWTAVFSIGGNRRWQPILGLLITSKLFCLLGVLLVFAPGALYALPMAGHHGHAMSIDVADQQLAGLLMLIACPASYVVAGIVLAARWMREMDSTGSAASPRAVNG